MPSRPVRPCSYPGCSNLVVSGRCSVHPYQDAHKEEHQTFYNTARWRKRSKAQLTKQPWCEECLRANIHTPATDADHIEQHHGDAIKFYTGRLQSLCSSCHSRKTNEEMGRGAKKFQEPEPTAGVACRVKKNPNVKNPG